MITAATSGPSASVERVGVVPGDDGHRCRGTRVLPARPRARQRLRRDPDVDRVVPAVVVAEELDDPLAARRGPRDPDRRVHRLAARVRNATSPPTAPSGRPPRELGLEPVRGPVAEARRELPPHGVEHDTGRVPEEEWAEAEGVVDVLVAVDVDDPRRPRRCSKQIGTGSCDARKAVATPRASDFRARSWWAIEPSKLRVTERPSGARRRRRAGPRSARTSLAPRRRPRCTSLRAAWPGRR